MQDGASFLHPHIVTAAKDLSILRNQASTDRYAALGGALSRLLHSSNESWILFHYEYRYEGWRDL